MVENLNIMSKVKKYWWLPLLTGILCIGIGFWLLFSPATSLPTLAYVFVGCLIAAGIIDLAYAMAAYGPGSNWGWALAVGILEVILGVWLYSLPVNVLTVAFIYGVGLWILFVAINSICESAMLSHMSSSWIFWMILSLIAVICLAVIFLSGPILGGMAVWMYLAFSFMLYGCYRIALAFKLRHISHKFAA